jgi:hypothetical protein
MSFRLNSRNHWLFYHEILRGKQSVISIIFNQNGITFRFTINAMTTEKGLNAAILKITLMIQEKFPELSKYIEEMPVNNPEINLEQLKDYYNSLENLIEKYAENH